MIYALTKRPRNDPNAEAVEVFHTHILWDAVRARMDSVERGDQAFIYAVKDTFGRERLESSYAECHPHNTSRGPNGY
jgi:hypothetical protein